MHIEFLVEEPSAEGFLDTMLPKIIGEAATWAIHPHQGKRDLLSKLPGRLRALSRWLPQDYRIVVLVDADSDDCQELKYRLEQTAMNAGLNTKANPGQSSAFRVLNRIAVEELEAWLFGDPDAICDAYSGVSRNLGTKAPYRDPDAIKGGTWEALERVLRAAGHHKAGLAKIRAAKDIARHMVPDRNLSHSFKVFCLGLRSLVEQ